MKCTMDHGLQPTDAVLSLNYPSIYGSVGLWLCWSTVNFRPYFEVHLSSSCIKHKLGLALSEDTYISPQI